MTPDRDWIYVERELFPLPPILLWRGVPGVNIFNALSVGDTYGLEDIYNTNLIWLWQYADVQDYVLGEYWKQTIVQVKLGVIPQNKQKIVIFTFMIYAETSPSMQVFIGAEYQPTVSMDPVPRRSTNRIYSRAIIVTGDGITSFDVFLRPSTYYSFAMFKNATVVNIGE